MKRQAKLFYYEGKGSTLPVYMGRDLEMIPVISCGAMGMVWPGLLHKPVIQRQIFSALAPHQFCIVGQRVKEMTSSRSIFILFLFLFFYFGDFAFSWYRS